MMPYNPKLIALIRRLRRKYKDPCYSHMNVYLSNVVRSYCLLYDWRDHFCVFDKEYNSIVSRRYRLNKYVSGMCATFKYVYFVTLTYSDDFSISSDTFKRYVREYLYQYDDYIACLDIGKKCGREHYHCLIGSNKMYDQIFVSSKNKIFYKLPFPYSYGFFTCNLVFDSSKNDVNRSVKSSAKYAFKASAYSFKSSDSSIKPFHKRGVSHFQYVDLDSSLPF